MKIKNISLKQLIFLNLFVVTLIALFLCTKAFNLSLTPVLAQSSSDALAVRIIPNPHHLSAQRWYQLQGFSGSPQSLIVDGYKAIRDGRTVYVSAANVVDNNLHTNIYLISYDQRSDQKTIDIFGKILNNWKLNTNLSLQQQVGKCLISNKACKDNDDCSEEAYSCGNGEEGALVHQSHKCVIKENNPNDIKNTPSCILDSDCPQNLFCSGLKAKIIRDLDRLEKVVLLKDKIQDYYNVNQKYPTLGAGTYLPHVAISTWPSWQSAFLTQVGISDISDPINKLGSCYDSEGKFDLDTCWNPVDNVFLRNQDPITSENFILPGASYAIAYTSNSNGSDYKMCATMETALSGSNYVLADGLISSNSCSLLSSANFNIGSIGNATNSAPYIVEKNLSGLSGTEFVAHIKAIDNENHPITWNIVSEPKLNTWGGSLEIINTNNPNQKIIKADHAGSQDLIDLLYA